MFILAKVLQALGLADVGFALFVGITQPHGMGHEYEFTGIGILVFLAAIKGLESDPQDLD